METMAENKKDFLPPQFKSYYVVWKLFQKMIAVQNHSKFKSYYVVWKQ